MKCFAASLLLLSVTAYAVNLTDFVPRFLLPAQVNESAAYNAGAIKPLIEVKRNSSSGETWYCRRNTNDAGGRNVFCQAANSTDALNMLTFESNSTLGDRTQVVDNATGGSEFGQSTSANQTSMEDGQVRNELDRTQGSFTVPLKPSNNFNMDVNPQQVEVNIKY